MRGRGRIQVKRKVVLVIGMKLASERRGVGAPAEEVIMLRGRWQW